MTTRPQSIRRQHRRIQRRTLVVGTAGAALVVAGIALAIASASPWALLPVALGVSLAVGLVMLRPRLRRVRHQLDHVERLRRSQLSAAERQRAAMELAFQQQSTLRSPFPSSSG